MARLIFSPKRVGLTSLNGTIESLTALVSKFALLHSFQQTPPIALVTPGTAFVAGTITLRISSTRVISRRRSSHVSSAVFPSRTQVLSGSARIESLPHFAGLPPAIVSPPPTSLDSLSAAPSHRRQRRAGPCGGCLTSYPPGDSNLDCVFDLADIALTLAYYNNISLGAPLMVR